MSYEFSNSLSEFVEFEGRIGDNRLALTYLRQEVADDQGRAGEALNLLFDVNNLFAPQWGLRVTRESGVIRGNAMYRDSGQATFSDPQSIDTAFSSRYLRMAADVTMERGFYFGLQYSRYNLPSAIGFSDSSGTVLYTTFEENLEIEKYTFRGGYDHIAYLRRYETEYSGLLYSGRAGIGLANLHISNSVKNEATTNTEKNKIEPLTTSAFDLGGEFGYVFLYRSKFLRGGGVILAAGYRVEASVFRSSRSGDAEQQDGDQDKLFLEFSRSDVIHGPFAKIAAVF